MLMKTGVKFSVMCEFFTIGIVGIGGGGPGWCILIGWLVGWSNKKNRRTAVMGVRKAFKVLNRNLKLQKPDNLLRIKSSLRDVPFILLQKEQEGRIIYSIRELLNLNLTELLQVEWGTSEEFLGNYQNET